MRRSVSRVVVVLLVMALLLCLVRSATAAPEGTMTWGVVDRLAEEVGQRKLSIVSGARISEVLLDQHVQAEAFVQLTRQ